MEGFQGSVVETYDGTDGCTRFVDFRLSIDRAETTEDGDFASV